MPVRRTSHTLASYVPISLAETAISPGLIMGAKPLHITNCHKIQRMPNVLQASSRKLAVLWCCDIFGVLNDEFDSVAGTSRYSKNWRDGVGEIMTEYQNYDSISICRNFTHAKSTELKDLDLYDTTLVLGPLNSRHTACNTRLCS